MDEFSSPLDLFDLTPEQRADAARCARDFADFWHITVEDAQRATAQLIKPELRKWRASDVLP